MSKTNIPEGWRMATLGEVAENDKWRKCKLGDILVFHYGKSLLEHKRVKGNYPVYGSAGLIGWHNEPLINSKGLIIGRKGTIGKVYKSCSPFFPIDTTYYVLPDDEKYDFTFMFYMFCNMEIDKLNGDSAVPGLNRNTAYAQDVILPSLTEQQAIAAVLSSLDDKIELLREQNKTLEAIAQAIYKRWFVDFEFPIMEPKNSPPFKEGWQPKADGVVYQEGMMPEGRGGIDKTINNKSSLKTFRRQLRNNLTPAEAKLWTYLQNKQLEGRKFRRQFSVDNYILDFYCPSEKLGIELDGEVHNIETQAKYDIERDLFLSYYGIKVLRFENKVVFENSDYLLECIKKEFGKDTIPSAEGCHFSLPPRPSGTPPFKEGSWELKGYKSSGGKMVESELGEIPEGWELSRVSEIIEFIKGVEPGSKNYYKEKTSDDFLPFYRVQDISEYVKIPNIFVKKELLGSKIFKVNDILISLDGTIGKVFVGGSGGFSSGIRKAVGKKEFISKPFILLLLKSEYFQESLLLFSGSGTTIQHAGKAVENILFAYDKGICEKFEITSGYIFKKIISNISQIQTLSALRDSLLPKLMSGTIRVPVKSGANTTPAAEGCHPSLKRRGVGG